MIDRLLDNLAYNKATYRLGLTLCLLMLVATTVAAFCHSIGEAAVALIVSIVFCAGIFLFALDLRRCS